MSKIISIYLVFLLTTTILQAQPNNHPPKREFRGVWVATVANIDWPSKPKSGLSAEEQQKEFIQILDQHQKTGINAIMLQVRPSADAFYALSREPWSMFLTGKQGLAPEPFYDPLKFAIEEAHKRGMELHAWFNPYRATNNLIDSLTSNTHITRTYPDWFFSYAGKKYFNPGLPQVRQYIIGIIMDVVRNYDIDGVHFDDYFYPYPGKELLPDTVAYAGYGQRFASIDDWRRHNVDTLIQTLSDSIHTAKPYMKFGISPFGIWRNQAHDPEGSDTNGLSGYSALFADARKWTREGWIDYVNPQIYFPFYYKPAAYEKLLDWWSINSFGRHLYIGQGVYRATEDREGWRDKQQLPNQVRYLRANRQVQGSVYFSSKSLTNNLAGFRDSLQHNFYKYPALPPVMAWLDSISPPVPLVPKVEKKQFLRFYKKVLLTWQPPATPEQKADMYGYVIYRFNKKENIDLQNPKNIIKISYDNNLTSFTDKDINFGNSYNYVITTLDRLKNESLPSDSLPVKIGRFF